MITDILIERSQDNIQIRTATTGDREDYIAHIFRQKTFEKIREIGEEKEIDFSSVIWNDRYHSDSIMFAIVETISKKTIGFCEIEQLSTAEPTIGITLDKEYQGKGYGYLATKMMIEEGWKLFQYPYFIWETDQDNIPSKRLAIKLGGKLFNKRGVLTESALQALQELGIEIDFEENADYIERYKIERP